MPIVVLDPGHGGRDSGAQGNGLVEKHLALEIAIKTRDILVKQFEVVVHMTRTDDTFISLSERAQMANRLNADYFVSFHHNAAGGSGFESYVYIGTRNQRTGQLQNIVHDRIMEFLRPLGIRDRGKKEANFAVLRETSMPAILLENLFVDNAGDAAHLQRESFRTDLANATAKGIASALGLIDRFPPTAPDWKREAIDWLYQEGLLTHEDWKKSIENPLPLWAEAVVLRRLFDKLNK
ncbi:N-acetylmuramoyl-L-alanine amidase [Ammoniphilus sp. YIM 78166]|uniref:N-acetylmuramoyl-L-alanine amidase n=1 Tax=Ammoniphilus sp. YIM 78166 TaxID=1644106 RepID=UPI00106F69D8|nr:N-acetylmuramoyl-L-alanine amidase [Ammoniphilus sp. YIM 78166]